MADRALDEMLWTVERGEYSDHKVMCACRTKAEAQAVLDAYNADEESRRAARLGRLPLVSEPVRITTLSVQVNIFDDDTTDEIREMIRTEFEFDMLWPQHAKPVSWVWVRAPIHNGKGGRLEVHGTDQERVRKVFSDTRARLLADDGLRSRGAKG